MSCRRMLSVEDRAAIMVGLEAGLSQVHITRSIGSSPSVVCREIARHRCPGGVYKAQDTDRAAQVAKCRPKKRLLDRDEVLRRRVIANLSQGRTPHRVRGPRRGADQRTQSGGSANLRSKARVQHFPLEWRCGESNPGPTAVQQDFSGCSLLKSFSASASHAN